MQSLEFIMSLIDRVSAPANKIMKTMDTVTTNVQSGYKQIGYGTAGLVGVGFALDRITRPVRELDNALREVKSLDVTNQVLTDLTKTSMQFSTTYGESASDFVRSSYDIQSAIGGLVGNELSKFTEASNILAKGTKANAATITNYVGTMYGIFQQNANEMGKAEWVQMLAGQTAAAVQIFKTTGTEMSAAFTSVGAQATSHGIAMNEQIAILGRLQATMSGSEAGTKYRAFLNNVGKAQETLGLQFTDSHGKMLPMVDILGKIQGKYGDMDTLAGSDLLKKAFGTDEAVALVKLLANDIDGLADGIDKVGQQKGMEKAMMMAEAMRDPFAVAGKQIEAIQIAIGKALVPSLLPFLDLMGEGAKSIIRWTELFPNLTAFIGKASLAIFGIVAAVSALSIAVGISKFLMVGWSVIWLTMKGLFIATKFSLLTLIPTVWAFTTALLANPITWIVLGITALIAVIVAAVVYWDVWTGKIIEWTSTWWEFLGVFALVDGVLAAFDKLPEWWTNFKNWLGTLDPFAFVGDSLDWVIKKINLIPGINIGDAPEAPKTIEAPESITPNRLSGRRGGALNRISNATQNNHRSIGDIHVHNTGQPIDGQRLMDEIAFAGG